MLWFGRLLLLLPWIRRRREQSLAEEIDSHVWMASEDSESAQEPQLGVRRDLALTPMRIHEDARAVWSYASVERIAQDLRYAFRVLSRSPFYATIAILSLSLGIGATTAMFSLVNTVLLKPLVYPEPERLVHIEEFVPALSRVYPTVPVNIQHFEYWNRNAKSFAAMSAVRGDGATYARAGAPVQIHGIEATSGILQVLGVDTHLGRGLLPGDDEPGKGNVAMITDRFWRQELNARPNIIGQSLVLDGIPTRVVGVLPRNFRFPKGGEFGPLSGLPKTLDYIRPLQRRIEGWDGDYDFICLARLRPGVSQSQALAELSSLTAQFTDAYKVESQPHPVVRSLQEVLSGPAKTSLAMLLAGVVALLLIVCLNVANLGLARASVRRREFSIRTALGAGQTRLVQQVLTENAGLGVAGGALGLGLATLVVRIIAGSAKIDLPRLDEVSLDLRVVLFALIVTVTCAVLCGMFPALRISRSAPHEALRSGTRTVGAHRESMRHREWLIGAEAGLSVVLLFVAGLLVSSMFHLLHVDKGFTEERAFAVDLDLPEHDYPASADRNRFIGRLLASVRTVPGVRSAALISGLPLRGESMVNGIELSPQDRSWIGPANLKTILVNVRFISPDYFRTVGIPVLRGSVFTERDLERHVTVISAELAARVWPNQNPIGKRFKTGSQVGEVEVVGVVKDVHNARLDRGPTLIAYVPYALRGPQDGSLVVRAPVPRETLISSIRERVWALDAGIPIPAAVTLGELVDESVARQRFQMNLATAFGIGALCLALIGIYGVVAYHVSTRRAEIGVRLAMGANPQSLIALMMWQGLRPMGIGIIGGLAISLVCGWTIRGLLFGIHFSDPVSLMAAVALLLISGAIACLAPALSTAHIDPSSALRYE